MSWEIEHTDEFEAWLLGCPQRVQERIVAMFPLLREHGPTLGSPFVDTLNASRHPT